MPSTAATSPRAATRPQDWASPACTRPERLVVKLGGSLGEDIARAAADLRQVLEDGGQAVVVHGGGAEADRLARELGRPPRHLTRRDGRRSRYTDAAALDALTLAMLGRVKPALVAALLGAGVPAVGLSAIDGRLAMATRTRPARALVDGVERVVRDDLSGRIGAVDVRPARLLMDAGYVPVVSPPALDPVAGPLNVDADRLAAHLAVALGADWLILLSNVPGLLRGDGQVVRELPCGDLAAHLELARGRMNVKVQAAAEAFAAGVPNVVLADGRGDAPVRLARAGAGTRITGSTP
jgi:acetylglutamate/LysW-gamma-L-alpha-aminoadipate kinase